MYPFSLLYGLITALRNRLYDWGTLSAVEFDIPTIAVGNLSMGGTGKTPHVEYLIRLLKQRYHVATLSRGYHRQTKGYQLANKESNALQIGDEPMQFHRKFPDIAVSVGEERVLALPQLLMDEPATQVVLLDDAFQHRSIRPGYNILVTEYSNLFTRDHIVPFGGLRESRSGYKRADCMLVSKCPAGLSIEEKERIIREIRPLTHQQLYFTTLEYGDLYDLAGGEPAHIPAEASVLMVCGIARPGPMQAFLENRFAQVETLKFRDHYYYTEADILQMKEMLDAMKGPHKVIVTTEKDAVRLQLRGDLIAEQGLCVYVLPMTVNFLFGEADSFNNHIFEYVEQALQLQQNTD